MKSVRNVLLAGALAASLALTSCNSLPRFGGNQSSAERAAEDRAGRLAMVLEEEKIAPNPGLAGVPIQLPNAQPVTSWTEAGGNPSKVAGHVEAAPSLSIAWRRSAGLMPVARTLDHCSSPAMNCSRMLQALAVR